MFGMFQKVQEGMFRNVLEGSKIFWKECSVMFQNVLKGSRRNVLECSRMFQMVLDGMFRNVSWTHNPARPALAQSKQIFPVEISHEISKQISKTEMNSISFADVKRIKVIICNLNSLNVCCSKPSQDCNSSKQPSNIYLPKKLPRCVFRCTSS